MPETPEQLWARAHSGLRVPPVEEWDTWPFEGAVRPKQLEPPTQERERLGGGGIDCPRCARPDGEYLWTDEHWRLTSTDKPSGLPVIVVLETRAHCDFPELPQERALELGPLLLRIDRAVRAVGDIGNVHVCRWGDGSEHCHIWLLGRPARMPQLSTSFTAIWDDVLPPLPEEIWRENLATVARGLAA